MNTYLSSEDFAVGTVVGGIIGVVLVIQIIWYILKLMAAYKVVAKMGEPGWKSLIPFYHEYILFKHVWFAPVGILYLLLGIAFGFIPDDKGLVLQLLAIVVGIIIIVIQAKFASHLSKAFGHGIGYALGIFFLEPVFTMILGFGNDKYLGNPSKNA